MGTRATLVLTTALALAATLAHGTKLPCDIHLTVSSLEGYNGNLELNWIYQCEEMPDWIGLFNKDPKVIKGATPLVKVIPKEIKDDYFTTNVSLGSPTLPGGWNRSQSESPTPVTRGPLCLDFWIASYLNGILTASDCLKIQPTWMSDKMDLIGKIPLSKMFLPGTHDSGSFYGDSIVKGEGLKRFLFTQEEDIWNQLVYGIRYLDIRIGHYYEEESEDDASGEEGDSDDYDENSFWINHDLVKVRKLVPILRDIKKFAEKAEDEIIIVDIHRLPVGFYLINGAPRPKRHEELINLLFQELGDLAIDYKDITEQKSRKNIYLINGPRMADIWETGKRLIICYPEESMTKGATWLWPPLSQKWGNKQSAISLKQYIQKVLDSSPPAQANPLWAVMAQMTPRAIDIIFNPRNDLTKMADSINRNLTRWVRDDWWWKANVFATDFFLGNNLIDLSIEAAVHKAINPDVDK